MKVLSHQNLVAPIRVISGYSTHIFLGALIDETGVARTCYVKAFLPGSRGLAGEIAGWLFAEAAGLRQPTAAWVILIKPHFLKSLWPQIDWGDNDALCWASLQLDCPSPENIPTRATKVLQRELRKWPDLPLAISLIELLANSDANGGNVLRIAPHVFALIDWADAFGGQWWTSSDLTKIDWIYNKLAHLSGMIGPDLTINPDDARSVMHAAKRHELALLATETTIYDWLSDLIGSDETRAAVDFLRRRIKLEGSRWHLAARAD